MKNCSVTDCDRPYYGNGYCQAHNTRFKRGLEGEALEAPLRVWRSKSKPRPPCSAPGCIRPIKTGGLCAGHYRRKVVLRMPDWDRPLKLYRKRGTTVDVSARISRESAERLARAAREAGLHRAELLRIVIENAFPRRSNPMEAA